MDTLEHPQSYYVATARPFAPLPELQGETEADVAVIGGGYTGLSAALNLAERGHQVVLIDQARIGWGASGRNGGQINTGLRKGPIELIARYGRDRAKALFDLAEEGRAIIRRSGEGHRIRCDLKANTLFVAHRRSEEAGMRAEVAALEKEFGYRKARFIPHEELDEHMAAMPSMPASRTMAAGTCIRSTMRWGWRRPRSTPASPCSSARRPSPSRSRRAA